MARRDGTPPDPLAAARDLQRPPSSCTGTLRTAGLVAGLLLAVGATAAVVLTDDARYLRMALLATCWAFLAAAFLAGGRRADQVAAQAREADLRHAYEVELEREVTARHEYELELADRLRRETEDGMRTELSALRGELASLAGLRGELAGLGQLRTELTGLAELRTDLGRLRGELSEQLSGELLIERMVMRAQSVRVPVDRAGEGGRSLDGDRWSATWEDPPGGRAPSLADARPAPAAPPPPQRTVRLDLLDHVSPVDADPGPQRVRQVAPPPAHRPSRHRAAEPEDDARPAPVPADPQRPSRLPEEPSWPEREDAGHARLTEILAESHVPAGSGGRRRRRYRDEDGAQADDVLARVLGRS